MTGNNVRVESGRRVRRVLRNLLGNPQYQFFASLALRLTVTESDKVETLAADGQSLFYSPAWVSEASADDIQTAIARVVLACALKHHTRRGSRDYKRWQKASQAVTLPLLRDAGLTTEAGGIDASVEQAYSQMPETPEDGEDGDGGNDPDGKGEIMDAPSTQKTQKGDEDGDGEGEGEDGEGEGKEEGQGKGSGQDGDPDAGTKQAMSKAVRDEEAAWDEAMHQAAQLAKAAGNEPGAVVAMIASAHAGQVQWRELLRRFMTAHANRDYTWTRPNRRFIDGGLYLPSLHSEAMGPVVFAIDSSGSMSSDNEILKAVWAEVRAAVEEIDPERVIVTQCDTRVNAVDEYDRHDMPGEIDIKGGGGTAFSPMFEAVDEMDVTPAVMVYLTDLYSHDHADFEPDYPVLWAVFGNALEDERYGNNWAPPFGEIVKVDSE